MIVINVISGKPQNRRQDVVNRRALRLCGGGFTFVQGGLTSVLTTIPLTYSVSYFNMGGLEFSLGGLAHQSPPVLTGLGNQTMS